MSTWSFQLWGRKEETVTGFFPFYKIFCTNKTLLIYYIWAKVSHHEKQALDHTTENRLRWNTHLAKMTAINATQRCSHILNECKNWVRLDSDKLSVGSVNIFFDFLFLSLEFLAHQLIRSPQREYEWTSLIALAEGRVRFKEFLRDGV